MAVGLVVLLLCGAEEGCCSCGYRPRWARDGEGGVLDCDSWQRLKEVRECELCNVCKTMPGWVHFLLCVRVCVYTLMCVTTLGTSVYVCIYMPGSMKGWHNCSQSANLYLPFFHTFVPSSPLSLSTFSTSPTFPPLHSLPSLLFSLPPLPPLPPPPFPLLSLCSLRKWRS